ncbi:ADP-ribosylglycohydrolase family protein [Micromonospora aurantiaca (nom. illeg.)]|uniref:ADP-ribosylglycohydrolase family protein n=1 Tax=Micromonospora aurantiaca (nom. illeg.) TaxID=47850 RepID=UPI003F4A1ECE
MSVGGIWQSERVEHRRESRAEGLLLAVGVGDALGWPFERRARRFDEVDDAPRGPFLRWERNAGNRFRSLPEVIEPGEYSDDTQMVIAVARARVTAGRDWVRYLRAVELPFFLAYERGAGAAVKRACRAWSAGTPPWGTSAGVESYFKAGANGAAMRVVPHVLWHADASSFDELADDIAEDAISTHGHPRAIIGALLHAFAHWISISQPAPIPYGWLLRELLSRKSEWSRVPRSIANNPEWLEAAEKATDGYRDIWRKTVEEVRIMLEAANSAVDPVSLKAPADVMAELGVSRGRETGSGTVCAVGAAYLATYNAAAPDVGLQTAARLKGADTDTLASMTASLLVAAVGAEWVSPYRRQLQDADLLYQLSLELSSGSQPLPLPLPPRRALTQIQERVLQAEAGDLVEIPVGRSGRVVEHLTIESGKGTARRVKVRTKDGQTMYFLSWPREEDFVPKLPRVPAAVPTRRRTAASAILGVDIFIRDLPRARQVLEGILNLKADTSSPRWVRYGTTVLRSNPDTEGSVRAFNLRVEAAAGANLIAEAERIGVKVDRDYGPGTIALLVEPGFMVVVKSALAG